MKHPLAPLLVFLLAVTLAGCSREQREKPVPAAPAAVQTSAAETMQSSGPIVSADPAEILSRGESYYRSSCASCHDTGAGGTPKIGDVEAWRPRIALGLDTLVHHAIDGYGSSACAMPPRGGHPEMHIEAVALAVRYMIEMSLPEDQRLLPAAK